MYEVLHFSQRANAGWCEFLQISRAKRVDRASPMRLALPAQGKIAMGPAGDDANGESDIVSKRRR
jgi:hypothetical protein